MRENNKLIAEFMGYETYEHNDSIAIRIKEDNEFNSVDFGHIHTKFHISWDWLMPVVEKILDLKKNERLTENITKRLVKCDLISTYLNVIEFIKQYKP